MIIEPELQFPTSRMVHQAEVDHLEVFRLLAAAIVNASFCNLLLVDPKQAIEAGYQGETFNLSDAERYLLLFIHADNLADLACQIAQSFGIPKPAPVPVYARQPVFADC
jgi:hypothetical protein